MTDKRFNRKKKIKALINDPYYQPMKQREIGYLMQVAPEDRDEFVEILNELVEEGSIEVSKRGKYMPPSVKTVKGTFSCTSKGFGFVTVEGEDDDYYIHEKNMNGAFHEDTVLMQVLDDHPTSGRRKEGKIIKILERGIKTVVGTLQKNQNFGFVIPDNLRFDSDIFVSKSQCKNLTSGFKVMVEITDYGDARRSPEGKIIEVLGHKDDPRVDILSIVKAYGIPTQFEDDVKQQVDTIPSEIKASDYKDRMDIRDWPMVTIDGEDAKDLDDAITLSRKGKNYLLGVHIADVSEYVTEYSPLDKEALKRGTSVYLVDRVIPMLPHQLSNGICSLNQGCDRLALSCIMEVDPSGKVVDHQIAETLINVDHRMTYTSVAKILDGDMEERNKYEDFVEMFELMKELSDILRHRRHERGSIDFDFPESKIILDEKGRPVDVYPQVRNAATKIIEDFMLCANETIAEEFYWREIPFLYRIHEIPDHEKIDKLQVFLQNFGIYLKSSHDEIHPKEVQKLLTKIEGTPEEPLISRLTLRSMKQAKYSAYSSMHFGLSTKYYCHFTSPIRRYPDLQIHRIIKETLHNKFTTRRFSPFLYRIHEIPDHEKIDKLQVFLQNFGIYLKSSHDEIHPKEVQKLLTKIEGTPEEPLISRLTLRSMKQAKYSAYSSMHFGLSTKYYCHFTSPIRRYPDLQIHRIIKETLHNKFTTRRFSHYDAILPKVAEQSSKMERRAEEVEREVCKLKKAEYMRRRIGEVHEGIISGVTNWGIYVELPNTIEGMVHVSILPGDYYYYDEKTYSMVGERTGRTFKLGEKAKIRVKDVDMMLKNIDFELVEDDDYEQSEDGWN